MARTVRGQISEMIREVEKAARQIRSEVRKQYNVTPKVLDEAASQLRRGAAEAAYQVERYIREVRLDLQAGLSGKSIKKRTAEKPKRKAAKRTVKRSTHKAVKRTAKKAARKAMKKTTRKARKRPTKKTARKTAKKRARR